MTIADTRYARLDLIVPRGYPKTFQLCFWATVVYDGNGDLDEGASTPEDLSTWTGWTGTALHPPSPPVDLAADASGAATGIILITVPATLTRPTSAWVLAGTDPTAVPVPVLGGALSTDPGAAATTAPPIDSIITIDLHVTPTTIDVVRIGGGTSGGTGVTVHNALSGRSTADAHPTSAITGLDATLTAILADLADALHTADIGAAVQAYHAYLDQLSAITGQTDGQVLTWDDILSQWVAADAPGVGSGAPADATYLTTTSEPGLSNETPVGATPGGELGGTWDTPTVDTVHSGSSHAATQAAAEATADAALTAHDGATTGVHGIADTAALLDTGDLGVAGGVAELDGTGKVPSAQLPSFVDDVVEAATFAALPGTGETGKIYVTLDDGKTWRWSGTAYVEISASLALGETSTTAYRGDRGKVAYDHSQLTSGNPHGVTAADVGALVPADIGTTVQGHDTDLDTIAGLTPSNDDFMQRKSGLWVNRSPAQVMTDLVGTTEFESGVRAQSIDQMTAPAGDVSWNGKRLTGLGAPLAPDDAVSLSTMNSWIQCPTNWTKVSATQFKIVGVNETAIYRKGRKLKVTQTSPSAERHMWVKADSTLVGSDTVVDVVAAADQMDGTLTAGTMYYALVTANPLDFKSAQLITPTWNGFSANPSDLVYISIHGGFCDITVVPFGGDGTSNASTMTITLPIVVRTGGTTAATWAAITTGPASTLVLAVASSTTLTFYKQTAAGWSSTGWTASGAKNAFGSIRFPV